MTTNGPTTDVLTTNGPTTDALTNNGPTTEEPTTGPCTAPFSLSGTSCFYAPPNRYTWQDGRLECQSLGGDLTMVKTAEKKQRAKEYLNFLCPGRRIVE